MLDTEEIVISVLWLAVALIALIPLFTFYVAYSRTKSSKLLFTTLAFSLFFVRALTFSVRLLFINSAASAWYLDDDLWLGVAAFLDITIIGLIVYSLKARE
jgi:hypothetical protein